MTKQATRFPSLPDSTGENARRIVELVADGSAVAKEVAADEIELALREGDESGAARIRGLVQAGDRLAAERKRSAMANVIARRQQGRDFLSPER